MLNERIRRVDELGRIIIPIEFRKKLGIENGDEVRITYNEDEIVIKTKENCINNEKNNIRE